MQGGNAYGQRDDMDPAERLEEARAELALLDRAPFRDVNAIWKKWEEIKVLEKEVQGKL